MATGCKDNRSLFINVAVMMFYVIYATWGDQ